MNGKDLAIPKFFDGFSGNVLKKAIEVFEDVYGVRAHVVEMSEETLMDWAETQHASLQTYREVIRDKMILGRDLMLIDESDGDEMWHHEVRLWNEGTECCMSFILPLPNALGDNE